MRSHRSFLIALPAFALGCVLSAGLVAKAEPLQSASVQRWEYAEHTAKLGQKETPFSGLNRRGWDGWEAYATYPLPSGVVVWQLRRPLR